MPRRPNLNNPFPVTTIQPEPDDPDDPSDPNHQGGIPPEVFNQALVLPNQHLSRLYGFTLAMRPFFTMAPRNDPVHISDCMGQIPSEEEANQAPPRWLFQRPSPEISNTSILDEVLAYPELRQGNEEQRQRLFESLLPLRSIWNVGALKAMLGNDEVKERQARLNTVVHGSHFHRGEVENVYSWGVGPKRAVGQDPPPVPARKQGEFACGIKGKFDRGVSQDTEKLKGVSGSGDDKS